MYQAHQGQEIYVLLLQLICITFIIVCFFFHFNYVMRRCDLLILKNNQASKHCTSKQVYSELFASKAANFLKEK